MRSALLFIFLLFCLMPRTAESAQSTSAETARATSRPSGQGIGATGAPYGQTADPSGTAGASGMSGSPGQGEMGARGMYVPPPVPVYVPGSTNYSGRSMIAPPAWAQSPDYLRENPYPPFGANLFQGYFAGTYYEGVNPGYVIMPGDRILVHIWGAFTFSDTLMVDGQGNIFLPEVGPVTVAGLTQRSLESQVRSYLSSTFRTNVQAYVNLLTAQPVAVYVTGFVNRPGRYAGGMSDSVLFYLDRAGGIIPERGSYREVTIQRGGRAVAKVDLYSFILSGKIDGGAMHDGDVIVVGPKGGSVAVGGLIPQQATYEGKAGPLSGQELVRLAAPLSSATHVSVAGTRGGAPYHVYLPMADFLRFSLAANDKVEFLADRTGDSVMVRVSGATLNASRFPVKRNTTLRALLAHVAVDPELANLSGIYIKRVSVVEQQRKALHESLYRLQKSVLTATSTTAEDAAMRVQEATLIQQFVAQALKLEPDGVVVVTRKGVTEDVLLENGDEVVIPQRSDVVQISGEVMIPKAIVYTPSTSLNSYIKNAGGFTDRADKSNVLVVHANGEVVQASDTSIQPGDMLMVMPAFETKGFQIFKDMMAILYQLAVATKVVLTPY